MKEMILSVLQKLPDFLPNDIKVTQTRISQR